jgi:hypothetical protein
MSPGEARDLPQAGEASRPFTGYTRYGDAMRWAARLPRPGQGSTRREEGRVRIYMPERGLPKNKSGSGGEGYSGAVSGKVCERRELAALRCRAIACEFLLVELDVHVAPERKPGLGATFERRHASSLSDRL